MSIKSSQELVDEANKDIEALSADEVKKLAEKNEITLIDVRDIRELWREGTIEKSIHIPRGMLEFWLDPNSQYYKENKIKDLKKMVLFCAIGFRSALATKALVDMKLGASGSVTHAGTPSDGQWYDNVRSLPPYWSATAYGAPVPASAYVVSITASTSSYGTYGSSTLGAGFTSQPTTNGGVGTTKYQEDYEALLDLLDYDAAKRTPWGTSNSVTYTQFSAGKYRHILMPIIDGNNNESAATALQMAGALFGTTVVEREFKGLVTGGNTYPINLQGFLQTGVAAVSVPYTGTTATEGRTIKGLHEYGFVPFMAMETDDDFATTNLSFKKVLASLFGLSLDYIGTNCAITLPLVQRMDSHGHYQFGQASACDAACTDAETLNASTVEIYNSTGTLFDTSVPAFSSIQGGNTSNVTSAGGTKNDELINDRWYAVYDGTTSSSRAVAQYKTAGSPFWDHVKICSGC